MTINQLIDRQIHPITGFITRIRPMTEPKINREQKNEREKQYRLMKKMKRSNNERLQDGI